MKISICIPTYNRAVHLTNCLHSIILNLDKSDIEYEVCVSDNQSTDNTEMVVRHAQKSMNIKYHKNSCNIGIARNFLNVVSMANGDFVWLIGDDDLLMPTAISDLNCLINENQDVDFFYVNSYHLHVDYINKFPSPFDAKNLPKDMTPFSLWTGAGEMNFIDLINPDVSFDFLAGIFLSVFRRDKWNDNVSVLDAEVLLDSRSFSHFDNTFPHLKIYAQAFSKSKAYFNIKPLNVCLMGAREWAPMYPYIRSVRLIEALDEYKKNGLSYFNYLKCKNFALAYFIPDLIYMIVNKKKSGYEYINPYKLILNNCMFPAFYLSFFTYFMRKIKVLLSRLLSL